MFANDKFQKRRESLIVDKTERTITSDGLKAAFRVLVFNDIPVVFVFIRLTKDRKCVGKYLKTFDREGFDWGTVLGPFIIEFIANPDGREVLRAEFSSPMPSEERICRSRGWDWSRYEGV